MTRWRWPLVALLAIGLVVAAWTLFAERIGALLFERAVTQNVAYDVRKGLPDGLHVILCGTGSPLPDPSRAGPCVAIIAGSHLMLFDTGEGSARVLARSGYPTADLEAVYLTHLHSDHYDGLGEIMLQSWVGRGRKTPLPLRGPQGVEQLAQGLDIAYRTDAGYRTGHHGKAVAPPSGFGLVADPIAIGKTGRSKVYDRDGLVITAFAVDHGPVRPAFGYRIDYGGRSVVVSGDTVASDNLIAVAQGADLLLHDALNPEMVGVMQRAAMNAGRKNVAKILSDIPGYHASPSDAAKVAQAAQVKRLVLTHIVPPLPNATLHAYFLRDAPSFFDGTLEIGEDGTMYSLPAGSDAIMRRSIER